MPPVVFEKDESEVETEFFMSFLSWLTENNKTLDFELETWLKYPEKHESTVSALVTNCAIDLVRLREAEFDRNMHRPKRFPQSEYPIEKLPALFFCWMTGLLQNKEMANAIMTLGVDRIFLLS